MKIYNVIHSINQSMSPHVETSYHLTEEEGREVFKSCMESVGDDYSTIYLEVFDTDGSGTITLLESFEGNMDDLEDGEDEDE